MLDLPELDLLHRGGSTTGSLIRIPPSDSVPLSARVRRILDTAPVRRLADISQLGLVALVYPGAMHTRLEHSLGVYHNALRFISRFRDEPRAIETRRQAEAFLLAALLHDIGHWPFCHAIEDMKLTDVPVHEMRVRAIIEGSDLAECVEKDWECDLNDIVSLLDPEDADGRPGDASQQFLASCLSGPIDIDKLDYLPRDSLHCGVPYGKNFDTDRLISSLVVEPETLRLAVGEKGRTAAEMMVFSRYVMFSEVYWHHAVRSATAMLQRSVFLLRNRLDLRASLRYSDAEWISRLRHTAAGSLAEPMVEGLFGSRRRLFKRVAEFSHRTSPELHRRLSRRPYPWLVSLSETVASLVTDRSGVAITASDILIDAPPVELEVDINVTVCFRDGRSATLGEVSPVAEVLADRQFDDHVKRVRVFVRPELRDLLRETFDSESSWEAALSESVQLAEEAIV